MYRYPLTNTNRWRWWYVQQVNAPSHELCLGDLWTEDPCLLYRLLWWRRWRRKTEWGWNCCKMVHRHPEARNKSILKELDETWHLHAKFRVRLYVLTNYLSMPVMSAKDLVLNSSSQNTLWPANMAATDYNSHHSPSFTSSQSPLRIMHTCSQSHPRLYKQTMAAQPNLCFHKVVSFVPCANG